MTDQSLKFPRFFLTAPSPCPYLPERFERKLFTDLNVIDATPFHDALGQAGFRRSQSVAYRPACKDCCACVSVRLRAFDFAPGRSLKRTIRAHEDLVVRALPPYASDEQFALLSSYLTMRHADGGMAGMDYFDYAEMVENTPVDTIVVEYREPGGSPRRPGRLIGVALTDVLMDGLSMVYSFFDPDGARKGLGTYMIADHAIRAKSARLPYLYLGYWIQGCRKMAYKTRFQPLERLQAGQWTEFEPD